MRILVVRLSSLGDVTNALPAIAALRDGLDASIDWVTQPEYAALAAACPHVERVISFPRRGFASRAHTFMKELRREPYDMAIDLQGLLKSAWIVRAARAKRRIGPAFSREGARVLYGETAGPRDRNRHAVDNWLGLVSDLLPSPVAAPRFCLDVPPFEHDTTRPLVAVAPVSRWATKNWPTSRFAEVSRDLAANGDAEVVLVGSPADREITDAIAEHAGPGVRSVAGRTSLLELAGLLEQARLLITNDSGPMHLAVAVSTPVVALFGPTDAHRTGPYGDRHTVLTADCECRPCFRRRCRLDHFCMHDITTEMVLDAARRMLANSTSSDT